MRLRRFLIWTVLGVAALGAGAWWYLRLSLPQLDGRLAVQGIAGRIEITRDTNALPHIYAASINDAYFGLGFVHAQDRLWQLEISRRVAAGQLSEIFGAKTLEMDKFLRVLGIRRAAQATLPQLSADTRAVLDAYARGVNAFLATHQSTLPLEFQLTGARPQAWSAADSIAWIKMMAWDVSQSWRNELMRLRLSARLTPQQLSELVPPYPGDAPLLLPDLNAIYPALAGRLAAGDDGFAASAEAFGSNNWVVSGARSVSGKPLLANDPHLGLSAPATFYFAHLSAPGLNAIGATLPGVPAIIIGRNDRLAWGFTNTAPDVQDLYVEQVRPGDATQYRTPQGWASFTTRIERIRVKGEADVNFVVRATRHGPVLSDVLKSTRDLSGHVLALAWTTLREDDLSIQAAVNISRARDWPQFVATLRDFHSPQQNVLYADVEGNIGFVAPGRVPLRHADNDLRGLAPAPGWLEKYDWNGWLPFDALPQTFNPPAQMIVTANHKVHDAVFPKHISFEWQAPFRAQRIERLLQAEAKHSLTSFQRLQADAVSTFAQRALPHLLRAMGPRAQTDALLNALGAWSTRMDLNAPEPLLFAAWARELARLIYADELGETLGQEYWEQRAPFLLNVLENRDAQQRWCDRVNTPQTEDCAQIVQQAWDAALAQLQRDYGTDVTRWRWGEAHQAHFAHRPFTNQPQLGKLFDVRIASAGDIYSVNVGRYHINAAQPFANTHAAALRVVFDCADLERSVFMLAPGQSGNRLSPFYANLAADWAKVRYLPLSMRREHVQRNALGTLQLEAAPH